MSFHVFTGRMRMSCATAALFAATLLPATGLVSSKADAQSATQLPPVTVEKPKPKVVKAKPKGKQPASAATSQPSANAERAAVSPDLGGSPLNSATSVGSTSLPASEIASRSVSTSDTATVLGDIPGVSVYTNGGVSGLPTIHGFADDRLRIKVDGMDTIASCPNHMNSPLSYIDPSQISSAQVWTGVTPVSIGGDAIGGAIIVNSREPLFAAPGQGVVTKGSVGAFYRSNGDGWGGNLSATAATEHFSLSYDGAYAKSDNYFAGGDFEKFPLKPSTPSQRCSRAMRWVQRLMKRRTTWPLLPTRTRIS